MSLTSANADEWIPLAPGSEGVVASAIGRLVTERRGGTMPAAFKTVNLAEVEKVSGVPAAKLQHLAQIFSDAQRPLAIAGGGALGHTNGLSTAKAILTLDVLVGSLGKNGVSLVPGEPRSGSLKQVQDLVQKMRDGKVEVLFIHGVNPLFELPAALGFADALSKVKTVISFATFPDETALASDWVLPDHSALESFGYQKVLAGADRQTLAGAQPVVSPLYDTRATVDVLLAAAAAAGGAVKDKLSAYSDEVDFLQKQIVPLIQAKGFYTAPEILSFWAKWQQYGGWWAASGGLETPDAGKALTQPVDDATATIAPLEDGKFYLVTFPTQLGDGSGANRPWLQETPDPATTVTWNTWVEMNPETAKKLGINDDDIVKITSPVGEIEAVVYRYPAIRPDAVALPFGQGHEALGRYAEKRGANPAKLFEVKTNTAGDLAYGDVRVTITKTGQRRPLARIESREGVYGKE